MIEDYKFGELRHAGKTYRSDVIIFPEVEGKARVDSAWWRGQGHRLDKADLDAVAAEKPQVLVVGTGYYGCMDVPRETLEYLRSLGVEVVVEKTADACYRYNRIKAERRAMAALHLTC